MATRSTVSTARAPTAAKTKNPSKPRGGPKAKNPPKPRGGVRKPRQPPACSAAQMKATRALLQSAVSELAEIKVNEMKINASRSMPAKIKAAALEINAQYERSAFQRLRRTLMSAARFGCKIAPMVMPLVSSILVGYHNLPEYVKSQIKIEFAAAVGSFMEGNATPQRGIDILHNISRFA